MNIFHPDNKEQLNIQQIDITQFQEKINENLGQYIDIKYNFSLNKNSFKQEAAQKVEAISKFDALKTEILTFLNKKYTPISFSEGDITNYFNQFKSPYHTTKETDNYSLVSYTSEHLNRLLTSTQWSTKNKNAQYNGKRYKKKNSNEIYFIDEKHLGIDLGLEGNNNNLYPTQQGKVKYFEGDNGGLGNVISLQHIITKNGVDYLIPLVTIYAHLNKLEISNNNLHNNITPDVIIAKEGSTPNSMGYSEHLHLELWKVNDSFELTASTKLADIRQISKSKSISYNYRYINSNFLSFTDKIDSSSFFEVDNEGNAINSTYSNNDPLKVNISSIAKNLFLNGNKNNNQKGIKDLAYNIIEIEIQSQTEKKYYNINKNLTDKKNIIVDEYSNKNINKQNDNIINVNFEKNIIVDDETKPLDIKIELDSILDKKDDIVNEKTDNITFGEEFKKDFEKNKTPIFTFYFPLRFNIFRGNYFNLKINESEKPIDKLLTSFINSQSNYYVKFEIFKIDFNDILKMKYEKSQQTFSITKNIEVKKKEIAKEDYSISLVKIFKNGNGFVVENLQEDYNLDFKILDHKNMINLFLFQYKKFEKKVKIEITIPSGDAQKNYINDLTILQKDPNLQYDSNESELANDNIQTSDALQTFIYNFFDARKPGDTNVDRDSSNFKKYLNNNFSDRFRNFFKEQFYGYSQQDTFISELPDLKISNIYDTTFYESPSDFIPSFKNLNYSTNNEQDIFKNSYNADLSSGYVFLNNKKDNPYHHIVDYPFVESQFFSHRIICSYLPKSLYEKSFVKLTKRSPYQVNKNGPTFYLYEYIINTPIKRAKMQNNSALEDYLFKPKNTNAKPTPLYYLEIDTDELYSEIIYNMISIEVFNIS